MTALTNDDIYGADLSNSDADFGVGYGFDGGDGMAGVSLNGSHTVEQTGKHVAMIALVAVVVLVALNRAGVHATVAAGR